MTTYGSSEPAISTKPRFIGDWLAELQSSVQYNLERSKLLTEKLLPLLGSGDPAVPHEKRDAEFPLAHDVLGILELSQGTSELLDNLIDRLRI